MTTPDERAERLAALRAQRQQATTEAETAAGAPSPSTPPPAPSTTRRQPTARAARLITVGASSTAVLGLMTAIGIAEQPVGAATPAPETIANETVSPPAPGTLRVPADATVIMVTVDETGLPIDLRQMSSVAELQAFLATAQPIVQATTTLPPATPDVTPENTATGDVSTPVVANETTPSAPAATTPSVAATTAAPSTAPATTAPAPVAEPATTTPPATTPTSTVPATTAAPAPTAPPTTVPVATPAPIEITLPAPTPPARGNTGGS